jgi:hypothetical protein
MVARVDVRVILGGELAISGTDLGRAGFPRYAKNLIVISFFRHC